MRDTSKIDLFSVGRRSFPNWETVCQIEGELATNSLINISQSELDYAEKHRASRLSELIAEENDSGIVYFCERYWLESFPIHRLPYNRWIADQFEVYRKEEELLNNEETKFIHLDFRLFVLPPLLSDDIKSWIDYQGIGPKCTICCDATIDVNYDWYVQATHLMHNVNYYLEMLSEVVTAWEGGRGDDICSLAYIHLNTDSNNSQIWYLAVDPGGGEALVRFLRKEPFLKEMRKDKKTDGPCWFPGCNHRIPEVDFDFICEK